MRLRCPEKRNRTGGKVTVESTWCIDKCDKAEKCEALEKKLKRSGTSRKSIKKKRDQQTSGTIAIKRYDEIVMRACSKCYEQVEDLDKFCSNCGEKL